MGDIMAQQMDSLMEGAEHELNALMEDTHDKLIKMGKSEGEANVVGEVIFRTITNNLVKDPYEYIDAILKLLSIS